MRAKTGLITIGEKDARAWELVKAVPRLRTVIGYGCAVANLVVAGLGTVISAFYEPYVNKT